METTAKHYSVSPNIQRIHGVLSNNVKWTRHLVRTRIVVFQNPPVQFSQMPSGFPREKKEESASFFGWFILKGTFPKTRKQGSNPLGNWEFHSERGLTLGRWLRHSASGVNGMALEASWLTFEGEQTVVSFSSVGISH